MSKSVLLSSDFLLLCMCKTYCGLLIMIYFIWRRLSKYVASIRFEAFDLSVGCARINLTFEVRVRWLGPAGPKQNTRV